MNISENLKAVYSDHNICLYEFNPTVGKLFYQNLEDMTFRKWVRFQLELVRGFTVYYMTVFDRIVGSCVVSRGGGRYTFASEQDIVVGPLFICEQSRGHGYAAQMIEIILNKIGLEYKDAWGWIKKSNIPSIKSVEKNGFFPTCGASLTKILRRFVLTDVDQGGWYIYRTERENREV